MLKTLLKEHEENCLVACRWCTEKMLRPLLAEHEELCKPPPRPITPPRKVAPVRIPTPPAPPTPVKPLTPPPVIKKPRPKTVRTNLEKYPDHRWPQMYFCVEQKK
jgi:hypothetical protein